MIVSNVSPIADGPIDRLGPISFRVSGALVPELRIVIVFVDGVSELIFGRGVFGPGYARASSYHDIGDDLGIDFEIVRSGGWDRTYSLTIDEVSTEEEWSWGDPWGGT